METVQALRTKMFGNSLFVEYYECSHDDESHGINLLMEPITYMTLSEYVE